MSNPVSNGIVNHLRLLNISVCNNLHRSTQRTIPPRSFGIPGLTHQPASTSDGGRAGDSRARRPGADGRCASRSRSPVPLSGLFGRATAGYVDRPQAAMGSRHRPGTAPGLAGDTPFAPPPAIQLQSRR